jgi:hypothetical protein
MAQVERTTWTSWWNSWYFFYLFIVFYTIIHVGMFYIISCVISSQKHTEIGIGYLEAEGEECSIIIISWIKNLLKYQYFECWRFLIFCKYSGTALMPSLFQC